MANLAPHELLDLEPDATPDEIRTAYRRLARAVHPDHNPGDPFAAARFREVRGAYEAMMHAVQRAAPVPTAPVRVPCVLVGRHLVGSLPVASTGARRHRWIPLTLWAMRTCAACSGEGTFPIAGWLPFFPSRHDCGHCAGTGVVGVERRLRIRLPTVRTGTAIRLRGKGLDASGHAFVHLT